MYIQESIHIQAPASKVWDALINPEITRSYMFGCVPVSSWKVGGDLLWNGMLDGKEITYVKGKIADILPERRLVYTAIDPHGPIPDLPENYLTITYALEEADKGTLLKVSQGDYSKVADGARRYQDSMAEGGWGGLLAQIKKIVEN